MITNRVLEPIAIKYKDPGAQLDYGFDWSDWLEVGDTISANTWITSNDALVVEAVSHTDTTTTVWITGGIAGKGYDLTNKIETVGTRKDERTIRIICVDR